MLDPDFGWHIKVGDWIIQNRQVPHYDELSHTMAGHEWVDHEWLINGLLAFAYGKGAMFFVIMIFSVMASLPFAYWIAKARSYASFFPLVVGAIAMSGFIFIRPAVISFFLFFLFSEILARSYGNSDFKRNIGFFAGILIFILVWANLHAGFITGVGLICLAVFFDHARRLFSRKTIAWRAAAYDLILVVGCALVPFANPYGAGLYAEVLRIATSAQTHEYIEEWQSPVYCDNWRLPLFYVSFVFIAFVFRKSLDKYRLFAASIFFIFFLGAIRNFMPFFVLAVPIMQSGAEHVRENIKKSQNLTPAAAKAKNLLALVFLAGFAGIVIFDLYDALVTDRQKYYPKEAVRALSEYAQSHRVVLFNEYGWGGYLALYAPQIKVFIDGRMPHWKDPSGYSLMTDYIQVSCVGRPDDVGRIFGRYGVNTALINNISGSSGEGMATGIAGMVARIPAVNILAKSISSRETQSQLKKTLLNQGWLVVYEDSSAALLVAP